MKCAECPDYRECSRTKDLRIHRRRCPKANQEKVFTFADRIRAMADEGLCDAIFQLIYAADPAMWFCKGKKECGDLMDADKDIPDEMCKACLLAKLREPVDGTKPVTMNEEKQDSGLVEED